ncbi:hypothetical protein [Sulfurimicrobium lacus]|nr:hypothetical protein [Sulfurimicrobium lacus]
MFRSSEFGIKLLAGVLIGGFFALPSLAQSVQEQGNAAATKTPAPIARHKASPYRPGVPDSAMGYYQALWGVDNMLVRQTASGNLIRFSYRVTDPARSKALGDKLATPLLYGQRSRAVLHIPVMDKIGQLRQTGSGEAGKEYWMVFSNKGSLVKPGDRVNVVIGSFHADGLMVE